MTSLETALADTTPIAHLNTQITTDNRHHSDEREIL
jgi:hypothetical protein